MIWFLLACIVACTSLLYVPNSASDYQQQQCTLDKVFKILTFISGLWIMILSSSEQSFFLWGSILFVCAACGLSFYLTRETAIGT